MPSNPASFKEWLSGKCAYSDPPPWTCNIASRRLAIVPAWKLTIIIFATMVPILGVTSFLFWNFWGIHSDHDIFGIVGMLLAVVFGIATGGLGFGLVASLISHFRGPYLIYSASDRSFSLPREHFVVPMANVLGWRLVSGHWVGPEDAQKKKEDPMSELQLIVKTAEGETSYAVVGGIAVGGLTDSMNRQVRGVAQATGLPLEIVVQHQGISSPAPSKRMQWWRARGM